MAQIIVETTKEEQYKVLQAIKKVQGKTVSVSDIAAHAGMNPNRVRYVIADLVDAGKVKREATKAFNKNYIRYKYEVTE